jgi:hypothetical protein
MGLLTRRRVAQGHMALMFPKTAPEAALIDGRHIEQLNEPPVIAGRTCKPHADDSAQVVARQVACNKRLVDSGPETFSSRDHPVVQSEVRVALFVIVDRSQASRALLFHKGIFTGTLRSFSHDGEDRLRSYEESRARPACADACTPRRRPNDIG